MERPVIVEVPAGAERAQAQDGFIFVATAERVDTTQLEMEFAATLAALDRLGGEPPAAAQPGQPRGPRKHTSVGRRDLRYRPLEEERTVLPDEIFEKLVAEGKAERIGFEESSQFAWKRGGRAGWWWPT